jgi:cytochrome c oxidase assembly factor CtaG
MLASSLAVLLAIYGTGLVRLWRTAGYGRGIRPFEAAAFGAGWITLAIALSPPLDEWSDQWLAAHMIQHELLMVIAAPLIAVSAPMIGSLWAMPAVIRGRIVDAVRRTRLTVAWSAVTSPASVFLLYAVALWIWHIPALYDAALAQEGVHVVQHLCFFLTAALFWWGIAHGRHGRTGYGAAVVYVFATAIHGGLLGALMTVSPRVWYAPYLTHPSASLTPLEDQQLAGLLMWVPASIVFVVGGLVLFAAWLRHSDRLSRFKSRPMLRPTGIR